MENKGGNTVTTTGIGFLGLLTIVFIALKLLHIIGWPWWAVLAPLWAPFILFVVAYGVLLLVVLK